MNRIVLRRRLPVVLLPILIGLAGCDIVTADFRSEETSEWRRSYQLDPGGRVEITNVNGKIDVQPGRGNTVEVVAVKKARGASSEAAKAALGRITIAEDASAGSVKIDTKLERSNGGIFNHGQLQVEYHVKVPAGTTLNGGAFGFGTIFRVKADGSAWETIASFSGQAGLTKGSVPAAGLMKGQDGNFYGTTVGGGNADLGTIFRVTSAGVFTTLVEFNALADTAYGALPYGDCCNWGTGIFTGRRHTGVPWCRIHFSDELERRDSVRGGIHLRGSDSDRYLSDGRTRPGWR